MEIYPSICSKAASVAATKTATSSLAEGSQQYGGGIHKTHIPDRQSGLAELVDLPLGSSCL